MNDYDKRRKDLITKLGESPYKALTAYLLFGNSAQSLCDLFLENLPEFKLDELKLEMHEYEKDMRAEGIDPDYEGSYDGHVAQQGNDNSTCWE